MRPSLGSLAGRVSFFGWIAALLLLNQLLVQALSSFLFHLEVERAPPPDVALQVATAARFLEALPSAERAAVAQRLSNGEFGVRLVEPGAAAPRPAGDGPPAGPGRPPPDGGPARLVTQRLGDGSLVEFRLRPVPPPDAWAPFVASIASVTVIVTAFSLAMAHFLSRRIQVFARIAAAIGRSGDAPPLPEEGPLELRSAARAFNRMQGQLKRFVGDRTRLMAMITHDLRAPLARLRLRIEQIGDAGLRDKAVRDLAEMEAMVSGILTFARHDPILEERQVEDLDRLLGSLCAVRREMGEDVAYCSSGPAPCECSPLALRRAFDNLLGNAVKYGIRARLRLTAGRDGLLVEIEDDGPGIPAELQERAFHPFAQLRAQPADDQRGVGLGLASVRTTIRAHGGDIRLVNRPAGGLTVEVSLPIAADAAAGS